MYREMLSSATCRWRVSLALKTAIRLPLASYTWLSSGGSIAATVAASGSSER